MSGDPLFCIGKILKTTGHQGSLLIHLEAAIADDLEKLESVYLELQGERIPFFFRDIQIRSANRAAVQFEDVLSQADAEKLTGAALYIPAGALPPLPDEKFYAHEITGFTVIDQTIGSIGHVTGILETPGHDLLQVISGINEILIPVVPEIILAVDKKKKTIRIDAPEGLIQLYTG
jgi:16S rRNA processing protein RimM